MLRNQLGTNRDKLRDIADMVRKWEKVGLRRKDEEGSGRDHLGDFRLRCIKYAKIAIEPRNGVATT